MKNVTKLFFVAVVMVLAGAMAAPVLADTNLQVSAGPDLYVTPGQTSVLQGSGYDSNGGQINYSWSCTGGTLSNYNVAQPIYTAPYNYSQATYTCTLTVTNNYGQSNFDSNTVYVNSNSNVGGISVQTNSATNVYNNSASLNGNLSKPVYNSYAYTWFQWGTTTNYGSETTHQYTGSSGSFNQNVTGLYQNTTYHFRAVAQLSSASPVYGNDMTFYTTGSGGGYNNYGGTLSVNKTAINFSSGNLNWANYITASPSDVIAFAVAIRAGNQDIHNVYVRDSLPSGLIYQDNFTLSGTSSYTGSDITSGITINTIPAGQTVVIGYQAQVASGQYLNYGSSTLVNNVTATSNEAGSQTASATINIVQSSVEGATYIPTGLTNNPVKDSFLLPILMIIIGSWFYFSGRAYRFADWLGERL